MGEYAERLTDGEEVKIGTCESMYYLRYEDRGKVCALSHSLDPATTDGLRWRLPFPDEDHILIGEYQPHTRGQRLYLDRKDGEQFARQFSDPETAETPGLIQLKHECGLLVNMPCFHGEKLPEITGPDCTKAFWNGKSWFLELSGVINKPDGRVLPLVHCRHCRQQWSYTWPDILPYLHDEMRQRMEKHATIEEIQIANATQEDATVV